jgi:hypothetical protein
MKSKNNLVATIVLGVALAIVVVVLGGISWSWHASAPTIAQPSGNNVPAVATVPVASSTALTKTYTPQIPNGSVTFQVAQAAAQLPGFVQATIDPANAAVGQVQHFVIVTNDSNPVTSVVAEITTDHKTVTVPLVSQGAPAVSILVPHTVTVDASDRLALLASAAGDTGGDLGAANIDQGQHVANAATANDTEFTGQWTVEDTHTARYTTTFVAKDSAGNTNSVTLGWTDPLCPFSNSNNYSGGTSTVSSSCTMPSNTAGVSAVDGPENGNLVVSGGGTSLTISNGASLVINSGYGISFSGGASLLIVSGGQILLGQDMCGTDNDGDGYIAQNGWVATTTCGAMTSRVNISSTDSFGDCNDNNPNVNPGQTAYFGTPTTTNINSSTGLYDGGGEVNFNYNCGPTVTEYYTATTTMQCGSTPGCSGSSYSCNNTQSGSAGWGTVLGYPVLGSAPACGVSSTWNDGSCSQDSEPPGSCNGNQYPSEDCNSRFAETITETQLCN